MGTKGEKRLFLITNATHYLNIRNYIETHDEAENYVVLAIRPYKGYKDFQTQLEADSAFTFLQVIFIGKEWGNKILEYVDIFSRIYKIKRLKSRLDKVDKVFFTNYNSWLHHYIVDQFEEAEPVLVSDGTAIFNVAEQRKKSREIIFSGSKFFKEKILKLNQIDHLHFYTQIEMDIAGFDTQEVFKFRVSEKVNIDYQKVYFVGSPLVEAGYLGMDKYLNYLGKIKERFQEKEIFYFAHRREDPENLVTYKFFGEVITDSLPFEERMKTEEDLPENVISIASSILINLPQVLPQVIFSYYVLSKEDIINDEYQKRYFDLLEVFEGMKSKNFVELK